MGHFVTGIIVKKSDGKKIASIIPFDYFHPLNQGFVIFPLTDDLIDEKIPAPMNFCFDEFTYLSEELSNMLIRGSSEADIMYFETKYFGGQGSQSTVVYRANKAIYGPKQSQSSVISEALELMGAKVESGHYDTFESVGLANFRSSESLLDNG